MNDDNFNFHRFTIIFATGYHLGKHLKNALRRNEYFSHSDKKNLLCYQLCRSSIHLEIHYIKIVVSMQLANNDILYMNPRTQYRNKLDDSIQYVS